MNNCICLLFTLFSLTFTNKYKEKVTLPTSDNNQYIFITQGFKSCFPCYREIFHYINEDSLLNNVKIYWVSEYKESIISRKSMYNELYKSLGYNDSISYVFDDDNNSFLTSNKIDISPSLVLYSNNSSIIVHHKEIFSDNGLNLDSMQLIRDFFIKNNMKKNSAP